MNTQTTPQCARLHLAAVRVHISICAAWPEARRAFGITFTPSGVPAIAQPPARRRPQ